MMTSNSETLENSVIIIFSNAIDLHFWGRADTTWIVQNASLDKPLHQLILGMTPSVVSGVYILI